MTYTWMSREFTMLRDWQHVESTRAVWTRKPQLCPLKDHPHTKFSNIRKPLHSYSSDLFPNMDLLTYCHQIHQYGITYSSNTKGHTSLTLNFNMTFITVEKSGQRTVRRLFVRADTCGHLRTAQKQTKPLTQHCVLYTEHLFDLSSFIFSDNKAPVTQKWVNPWIFSLVSSYKNLLIDPPQQFYLSLQGLEQSESQGLTDTSLSRRTRQRKIKQQVTVWTTNTLFIIC